MSNYLRTTKLLITVALALLLTGCKNGIMGPGGSGENVICYEKSYNGHWEIFTNNITGSNPLDISNYSGDDEYPQWSPDGKYILYSRRLPGDNIVVMVYDTKAQTNTQLTPDSGLAGSTPQWTPNGKICFSFRTSYWDTAETYLMNPDASNKRKILSMSADIYFYQDGYAFLYINGTILYRTNIDKTFSEFISDIDYAGIEGFNPNTEEFLVVASSNGVSVIATYSIKTKSTTVLLTSEQGYAFFQARYSHDFSKIAFVEHSNNDEYLSVLENGVRKRLLRIPASTPPVYFSYNPMQFSPDGKYIAFSEQIFHTGRWVLFSTPLFIVDVTNLNLWQLEDEAHGPSWNPQS
jgi:Tol biopolymer transport system component